MTVLTEIIYENMKFTMYPLIINYEKEPATLSQGWEVEKLVARLLTRLEIMMETFHIKYWLP